MLNLCCVRHIITVISTLSLFKVHMHVDCVYVFQGFSAYTRVIVSLDLLLALTINFLSLNPHDFDIDMLIPNHSLSFLF